MNTTHLLASAPAALLLTGKARDAGNVTCGAKLERGKAQKTGGKIQNNLERRRRTEGHHKGTVEDDDLGQCLEKCKTPREPGFRGRADRVFRSLARIALSGKWLEH